MWTHQITEAQCTLVSLVRKQEGQRNYNKNYWIPHLHMLFHFIYLKSRFTILTSEMRQVRLVGRGGRVKKPTFK